VSAVDPKMMAWFAGLKPAQDRQAMLSRLAALERSAGLAAQSVRQELGAEIDGVAAQVADMGAGLEADFWNRPAIQGGDGSVPFYIRRGQYLTSVGASGYYTIPISLGFTHVYAAWGSASAGALSNYVSQGYSMNGDLLQLHFSAGGPMTIAVNYCAIGN
jgi:hypothetical protein